MVPRGAAALGVLLALAGLGGARAQPESVAGFLLRREEEPAVRAAAVDALNDVDVDSSPPQEDQAQEEAQELVRESVKSLEKRKDHFAALLRDIPGLEVHEPDGTFYFWVGINAFLGKSFEGKPYGKRLMVKNLMASTTWLS